ncbi:MAG: TIGR00304 family membrane protein [Candidatus Hecatellaceae archaeon]
MEELASLGFLLIFLGFAVIFVAVLYVAVKGGGRGGGVILIGPFPIVFGSDTKTVKGLMLLALILIVAFILLSLLLPLTFTGWWKTL